METPKFKLSPASRLTDELINKIEIHLTPSSLKRAGSTSPCIKRIEGSDLIPTLYYIKSTADITREDWTVHALQSDISKFLLHTAMSDLPEVPTEPPTEAPTERPTCPPTCQPTDLPMIHSKIRWDKVTGGRLTELVDGGILILSGDIQWNPDENPPGHYVCAIVTPSQIMIERYPDAKVIINGVTSKLSDKLWGPEFSVDVLVENPGYEFPFEIKWTDSYTEHFIVAITQESVLL